MGDKNKPIIAWIDEEVLEFHVIPFTPKGIPLGIKFIRYSDHESELTDLKVKYEIVVSALKHYSNEVDNKTYLDIFDCIKRESDAVTSFDEVKFARVAREVLAELGEL